VTVEYGSFSSRARASAKSIAKQGFHPNWSPTRFAPLMTFGESTSVQKSQERTRESGSGSHSNEHHSAGDWPSFAPNRGRPRAVFFGKLPLWSQK
jgi:hypothetical protein